MKMTKKELIAKVKSKPYEENVINTIKALHGLGYEEAARTMQELYTDAKALTVTAKASGKYSDDPELDETLPNVVFPPAEPLDCPPLPHWYEIFCPGVTEIVFR